MQIPCADLRNKKGNQNILQTVDEFAVIDGGRVDDLLDQVFVTVGVRCGDVNENLQMFHPASERQHLLGGQNVQLHRIPETQQYGIIDRCRKGRDLLLVLLLWSFLGAM